MPNPLKWRAGSLVYSSRQLAVLGGWLLWGDFAFSLKERSVPYIVQVLLHRYHASDLTAGIVVGSIPQALWIVAGPLISYRSDQHRGPLGRRIPYLIITVPVVALAVAGLAASGWIGQRLAAAVAVGRLSAEAGSVLALSAFWVVFELAAVAGNTVFLGLINDVVPRQLIGRFFGLFRGVSLIAGMIFNYAWFGRSADHPVVMFLGMGAIYLLGFSLMAAKVKEGTYPPPHQEGRLDGWEAFSAFFRQCFGRAEFCWVYAGVALAWMGQLAGQLFAIFFAQSLGLSLGDYGKYVALTYLISLGLSYPLGMMADKINTVTASVAILLVSSVVDLWGGFWATSASRFAAVIVVSAVCNGAQQTLFAALPQKILPNSSFAQYNSALEMVKNFGMMLVGPVVGLLLDATGHTYRYTYLAAGIFTVLGLACLICARPSRVVAIRT